MKIEKLKKFYLWAKEVSFIELVCTAIFAALWLVTGEILAVLLFVNSIVFYLHERRHYYLEKTNEKITKDIHYLIEVVLRYEEIMNIARDLYPDFDHRISTELKLRKEREKRKPPKGPKAKNDKKEYYIPKVQVKEATI